MRIAALAALIFLAGCGDSTPRLQGGSKASLQTSLHHMRSTLGPADQAALDKALRRLGLRYAGLYGPAAGERLRADLDGLSFKEVVDASEAPSQR